MGPADHAFAVALDVCSEKRVPALACRMKKDYFRVSLTRHLRFGHEKQCPGTMPLWWFVTDIVRLSAMHIVPII